MKISIIVAFDEHNGIGKDNALPWRLPADLKHFKAKTTGHHMLMGRKTFESIGKPLPGRTSIVVTRQDALSFPQEVLKVNTIEKGIALAEKRGEEELFIIGGGEIYKSSVHLADTLYLTTVKLNAHADTFFPEIDKKQWKKVEEEQHEANEKNKYNYAFSRWIRQS